MATTKEKAPKTGGTPKAGKDKAAPGATDAAPKAAEGTLRREFGTSIERNATHGSDAPETAAFELGYFFRGVELI